MQIQLNFKYVELIQNLQDYGKTNNNELILNAAKAIKDLSIENHMLTYNNHFVPICLGCKGKTKDGERTELCGYDKGDFSQCIEQSQYISNLILQDLNLNKK